MRKLYDFTLSGNCHKIRMMLSLLDLEWERVPLELPKGEQKRESFLALNPMGKLPVLEDDGLVLRDSSAILVYLARRYGRADWYPDDAAGMGQVQQWLSLAVNEVFNGLAIARAIVIFKRPLDPEPAKALAGNVLTLLEAHLRKNDWLALGRPTVADIACYPYAALVEEGNVSLAPFGAVRAWFERIEALPGYVAMPGLPYGS